MSFQTINPSELTHAKLHEYLLSAVAPRPIAFVSTINKNGVANLAPFSFFNCFGSNPPVLVFSPARSGRTGATKHTHDNVQEVKECVVNIPHYDMLYQMNLAAHMYEKGVDEFSKSGLTAVASVVVKPPRVAECFVQFECEVKDVIETGQGGGAAGAHPVERAADDHLLGSSAQQPDSRVPRPGEGGWDHPAPARCPHRGGREDGRPASADHRGVAGMRTVSGSSCRSWA